MTIRANGTEFEIECMEGNDECFEMNEFYQIGYTANGNEYRFFFEIFDENGEDIALENVDYTTAYRVEFAVRDGDGELLYWDKTEAYCNAAFELMDFELEEEISAEGNFFGDPEGFLREYKKRHYEKFGEEFEIN